MAVLVSAIIDVLEYGLFISSQELLKLINSNQVVVISGETGCGKTTQVSEAVSC